MLSLEDLSSVGMVAEAQGQLADATAKGAMPQTGFGPCVDYLFANYGEQIDVPTLLDEALEVVQDPSRLSERVRDGLHWQVRRAKNGDDAGEDAPKLAVQAVLGQLIHLTQKQLADAT